MNATKEQIIRIALQQCNERGLHQLRLQQIADGCGISVGNLAYHFPTRQKLLSTIMREAINAFISDRRLFVRWINLIDFDNFLTHFSGRMRSNMFLFTDVIEIFRSFQKEYHILNQYFNDLENGIKKWIQLGLQNGLFQVGSRPNVLNELTESIIFHLRCYPVLFTINEVNMQEVLFRKKIWLILYPYLGQLGQHEYEAIIAPKFDLTISIDN